MGQRWTQGQRVNAKASAQGLALILSHTGIRPGAEEMNLKWQDVGFFMKNGNRYLSMRVNGKTGVKSRLR